MFLHDWSLLEPAVTALAVSAVPYEGILQSGFVYGPVFHWRCSSLVRLTPPTSLGIAPALQSSSRLSLGLRVGLSPTCW